MPVLAIVTRKAGTGAGADDDGAVVEVLDAILPFDKAVEKAELTARRGGQKQPQGHSKRAGQRTFDAISISDLEISASGVDVWVELAELGKGDVLGCHQCS